MKIFSKLLKCWDDDDDENTKREKSNQITLRSDMNRILHPSSSLSRSLSLFLSLSVFIPPLSLSISFCSSFLSNYVSRIALSRLSIYQTGLSFVAYLSYFLVDLSFCLFQLCRPTNLYCKSTTICLSIYVSYLLSMSQLSILTFHM